MNEFWGWVTAIGYLLAFPLILWVLHVKKHQTVSTVAWILAVLMLPYLGGLFFLMFGINRVQRRGIQRQRSVEQISQRLGDVTTYQMAADESLNQQQKHLVRLANQVAKMVPTGGNHIELLNDTNRMLALIEQSIESAEQSLHLEYYIWQPDRTGTRLRDLLIRKAKEGVTVRFLYDSIGSLYLNRRFLNPMRDAGIQIATFLPGATLGERWSMNLRNHRKIVIVDGQTAYTGGMNIGDEYLGKNPYFGFWRDTHLKLRGPAVLQLQQVFAEDWFYATGEELTDANLFPRPEGSGDVYAQVIPGGPDTPAAPLHALMFAAINEAHECVTLATSYFVPPPSLVTALETAAYRGLRVQLLLSGRSNYWWTLFAGRSYYESLLEAGAEIYEYQHGLLHSKVLTIDGNWSLVGSPNFDARSLFLNFEVAVAIYDREIAAKVEHGIENDLKKSSRIESLAWNKRPFRNVTLENFCRLFAPLL